VHRGPLEDDSLSEKHPTNLRLALLWQDTVVTEKVLKKGQIATIGEDLSNTIVLPDIAGIGTKYPLFTPTPSGYVLNLTPQMKGRMRHDADEKSVEDVRKAKGDKISVDYHDWGLLELGQLQIFFGFVSDTEEIPAPPLFQRFETGTLSALLLAYVMQVGPLIAAFWLWDDKPNLQDLEQRDRVVGYVFEKPPEEIEEEKEEKQEDVGKKAGGEEGKFGEEDKKEKTKVPLQDGQMVDKVKNMALTKALTSNLMGKGPLQNVFSDKTAFASKLNAAMSGEGSELVMGHGYGGMGMRGMGTGGGGEGFGRPRRQGAAQGVSPGPARRRRRAGLLQRERHSEGRRRPSGRHHLLLRERTRPRPRAAGQGHRQLAHRRRRQGDEGHRREQHPQQQGRRGLHDAQHRALAVPEARGWHVPDPLPVRVQRRSLSRRGAARRPRPPCRSTDRSVSPTTGR
jgi:hypothetical protein